MNNNTAIIDKAQNLLQMLQTGLVQDITAYEELSDAVLKKKFDSQKAYFIDRYNDASTERNDDLAVIVSFYGMDINRISSTVRAVRYLYRANPRPSEIIFVEAQTKQNNAVFRWLENFGIRYFFREIPQQSVGLLLKTALWNFGAGQTKCSKLCFVDSDVVFCNQDWTGEVSAKLDRYDIISPFKYSYYEGRSGGELGKYSIGWTIQSSDGKDFSGHPGFGLAMTRHAYEKYGMFEGFSSHDDIWIWQKITGGLDIYIKDGWIPYRIDNTMATGLPLRVGSAEKNICCHLEHGDTLDRLRLAKGLVTLALCDRPFEDIVYDPAGKSVFPEWSSGIGEVVRDTFTDITRIWNGEKRNLTRDEIMNIAGDELVSHFGEIPDSVNLFIVTATRFDFAHQDTSIVSKFGDQIRRFVKRNFNLLCVSNICGRYDRVDFVKFSSKTAEFDRLLWPDELNRDDLVFPDNSAVVYAELTENVHGFRICKGRRALVW